MRNTLTVLVVVVVRRRMIHARRVHLHRDSIPICCMRAAVGFEVTTAVWLICLERETRKSKKCQTN